MPPVIGITGGIATGPQPPEDSVTRAYWEAVTAAGGLPLVLASEPAESAPAWLERLDGVLFAGGCDVAPEYFGEPRHPALGRVDAARDAFELALFKAAWAREDLPVLGVCRGLQVINIALGGTLWQDLPAQLPSEIAHLQRERRGELVHDVRFESGTLTAALLEGTKAINSIHHQAIKDLAPGLREVAWGPDGVIEAVEAEGETFRLAVQWHPEVLAPWDSGSQRLFKAFIEAAEA